MPALMLRGLTGSTGLWRRALCHALFVALIHDTTLSPTKLELLTAWLPTQPWYRGAGQPSLSSVGGFRLDDPEGEVGVELIIVTDAASVDVAAYLVPLTYRGGPLDGGTLVGTLEHGVLGKRYVYDGVSDPVFRAQALALVRGAVQAQARSVSNTVEQSVRVQKSPAATDFEVLRVLRADPSASAAVIAPWIGRDGAEASGAVLRAN